jgi:hypothetical protein
MLTYYFSAMGRREEALKEYREALRCIAASQGPEHPDTAKAYNNIATELYSGRNFDEVCYH